MPRAVIQALYDGQFVPVVTELILTEYADVLQRPVFASKYGVDPVEVAGFLEFLREYAVMLADVAASAIAVRDDLDQKFLDAALAADAGYLVSGDNDLLVHADDPRLGTLRIVTARAFLEAIRQE